MIQKGFEMDFRSQNFGVILYGAPGIGKTTAAISDGANGGSLQSVRYAGTIAAGASFVIPA